MTYGIVWSAASLAAWFILCVIIYVKSGREARREHELFLAARREKVRRSVELAKHNGGHPHQDL